MSSMSDNLGSLPRNKYIHSGKRNVLLRLLGENNANNPEKINMNTAMSKDWQAAKYSLCFFTFM